MKKNELLENDSTLRLIFAFNDFTSKNVFWEEESKVSRKNRKIAAEVLKSNVHMADEYFRFGSRLYAVSFEKQASELIECEIQEYNKFYELADEYLAMRFSFNPATRMIERLDNVETLPNIFVLDEDISQKTLNVA